MTQLQPTGQPLRQFMLRRAGVLVVVTTLLVAAGFVGLGLLPMAQRIARDQFDATVSRVQVDLNEVFMPPQRLLSMGRGWLNGAAPDLASPQAFNQVFQPVLRTLPQLTSVVAGTSAGQGWLLLKQSDGSWRNRMTDIPQWGPRRHWLIDHRPDGTLATRWGDQLYDPRLRPWYLGAQSLLSEQAVYWTAPYSLFTTGDPGITASSRWRLADGRDFVLGVDLTLRDLSRATMQAKVSTHGLALVVSDDLRVLALPSAPAGMAEADWHQQVLKPAAELGLTALRDGLARWQRAERQPAGALAYASGGSDWLISARDYPLGQQHLWVLVLAPASDFAPAWGPIMLALGLALLLALMLSLWLIHAGTLRLTRPLEALAAASQRIGQLDFQPGPPIHSSVAEVAQLASSQQAMIRLLQDNQRELDARAQTLSLQVAALQSTELRLQQQNDQLATIIDNFPGGVLVVDAELRVVAFNAQFQSLLTLPDELLAQPALGFEDLIRFGAQRGDFGPGDVQTLVQRRLAQIDQLAAVHGERTLATGITLDIRAMPLPQGGFVALYVDVTAAKQHERELEHLAHFDALTGLPNRVLLADRLRQAMPQVQRRGQKLVLAFLDLDGFKAVNDRYGHAVGDQLLLAVTSRMKQTLRDGDTLARLGGDEFVVVLMDVDGLAASTSLIERLLLAVDSPAKVDGRMLRVSASIGVTLFPQSQEVDAEQLLRQADQAMYQAKQAGKNRYQVFDAEQDRQLRGQLEEVQRLQLALANQELVLYYQPKVNMRTSQVVGAEALIRWQHPHLGLLAPAAFLPLIENHPLAVAVGRWVIQTALTQMVHWLAQGLRLTVSVNIGARQLQQAGFVDDLRSALQAHPQVHPQDLKLEVLETSALEDMAHVTEVMAQCRELGVDYALDDFGTGYSSLTYLKRLPVTQLKVDQSFVRDMLDDPDDLSILLGVLDLAASFHRQVIAEGVETVAHGQLLLLLGCELAQGYGIARPMPAQDLPAWVAAWPGEPLWHGVAAVPRGDLPLLFAAVEHRAWVAAMVAFLKGEAEALVPLNSQHCHVGKWLSSGGLARLAGYAAVDELVDLHQQVHDLAAYLCDLKAQGQTQIVQQQLPQLTALRDVLLAQLQLLLREPHI
ncbi:EAL domain-containing protein [Rhodoferax sp.]|uniref:EAL domain-containing protein n=1 Tax=Rhodoferax sp. TaxID=50421 RepID=UPI002611EB53|nr:EAL domain-containing protein [Rhodoferax sp.]MDD2925051.1 EAL domain-containing protein [Rhodoferax sp.]